MFVRIRINVCMYICKYNVKTPSSDVKELSVRGQVYYVCIYVCMQGCMYGQICSYVELCSIHIYLCRADSIGHSTSLLLQTWTASLLRNSWE